MDDRSALKSPKRTSPILPALKAALLYFVCAVLWFGTTDGLARMVSEDPARQRVFKSVTGLGFVLATAVAISLLVRREFAKHHEVEAAWRESEARFRMTADNAPVMIWMSGPDKLCTWFNKPWLEFVGRTMEQELGNGWAENVHADDLQRCLDTYTEAFDARREFQMEYRLRRHDGEYRWVLDNGVPRFSGSEFLGYAGSCLDITGRKRAETELNKSQGRLAGIIASAMDGIITVNAEQRIVLFNAAAEQMFGYRAEELVGQPLSRLIPERFHKAHSGHVRSFGEAGVTNRQMGALGTISGLRADGTEFPIEASISHVDAGGQKLFTVILRDITARNQAEENLRESQERIRAIVDTAVEGIITIDQRGAIESVNPAAEKTFGYAASELVGRNVSVLMPSPYRDEHDGYLANYLRTREAKIIGIGREVVGRRKDGTVFPMDLSVSEVKLPGKRLFTGFVRDITQRKRAEAEVAELAHTLAEKNRELEAIVYAASHDLRSPLVNIQGFSKELARICEEMQTTVAAAHDGKVSAGTVQDAFATDIPRALHFIHAGVFRIDALLNGFLRFSRLGRVVLTIQTLDMNALVVGVAHALKFQLEQAGANLELEPLPDCRGDATHVGQVFSNLIDNALKYRDPGRPLQITVSGRVEGGSAIYTVRDNGIGIAPEHREKIFEIFHRLNPNAGAGEGLGLTIAQRILERHNGRIWVEGEPGTGSTFFVSLPAGDRQIA